MAIFALRSNVVRRARVALFGVRVVELRARRSQRDDHR
jgi:hypothetical protein